MSLEEHRARKLDNPFIHDVERWGKVLHNNPEVERRMIEKIVELADNYCNYALKCRELLMYRAAIDLGQNAVELLLKALIIASGETLPHGGYIHKFGELYVLKGKIPRDIMTKLYKALELRNRARYDPDYEPTELDAEAVLETYRELRNMMQKLVEEYSRLLKSS